MADCWFHIWQRKSAHANRIKNETTLLGTAFLLCQAIYPIWKKEILWFKLIGRRGHCWFITPYKYKINTGRAGNYQRQINNKLDDTCPLYGRSQPWLGRGQGGSVPLEFALTHIKVYLSKFGSSPWILLPATALWQTLINASCQQKHQGWYTNSLGTYCVNIPTSNKKPLAGES